MIPVLRSSTAPLPGRPAEANTHQAVSHPSTEVGDLVLVVSLQGLYPSASGSSFSIRSGYTPLVNHFHDDGNYDGSLGIAWKFAEQPGAQVYQAFDTSSPTTDCRTALRVYQKDTFDISAMPFALAVSFIDGAISPDPGNIAGLDSSRDYLVEVIGGWILTSDTVNCIPGAPAGFSNLIETGSAGWLDLALANQGVSGLSSFDPGAFTDNVDVTNNRGSIACAVAILGTVSARRAIISHAVLTAPEANLRRARISHAVFTTPEPVNARRAIVSHAVLRAPDYAFPGQISYMFHPSWARYRYQVGTPVFPAARRAIISHAVLTAPVRERRAIISHAVLQAPTSSQGLALGVFFEGGRPPATREPPYVSSIGRYPDSYRENLGGGNISPYINNNWTWIANPGSVYTFGSSWGTWLVSHPERRFLWHVNMCPWVGAAGGGTHGNALPQIVSGQRDTEWRSWADYAVANNLGGTARSPVYIGFGWEMDGNWYSHGTENNATKMANFKAAWRRIVDVVRTRQPGANWKFCFNPTIRAFWNYGLSWAEAIYPGDDVVDLIGSNFYDVSTPPYSVPPTAQEKIDRWTSYHLVTLQRQDTFATSHGKRQFWGEFGVFHDKRDVSPGGDDNPYFIEQAYLWATTHDYEFVNYFDDNNPNDDHSLTGSGVTQFPNSRAMFLSNFAQLPHPW